MSANISQSLQYLQVAENSYKSQELGVVKIVNRPPETVSDKFVAGLVKVLRYVSKVCYPPVVVAMF